MATYWVILKIVEGNSTHSYKKKPIIARFSFELSVALKSTLTKQNSRFMDVKGTELKFCIYFPWIFC